MNPTNFQVLVIDDDQWIVESTAMVLEAAGLSAATARSGERGIELAQQEQPGVILLDIMMPGLDGWETLDALKTNEATREIPVVIFSARDLDGGSSVSRVRGADSFLRKPFEPEKLLQLVRRHLKVPEPA
ncbi:MAG: response regulator [Planctomycetota bacterium]